MFSLSLYRIDFPAPYDLVDYAASSAVNVSGIGTRTVVVDPGPDPNPLDSRFSEWVSLVAKSPDPEAPTIASPTATPSPAEAGQPILFAAVVSDNDVIALVTVEVRDGSGSLLGNFEMTFNAASGRYEVSLPFTTLGTLTYRVWAEDASGNQAASAIGNVVVRDTTRPTVTGTSDTPDPVELGAAVTISAQATDAVSVAQMKVEVRDPQGDVMGNVTMVSTGGNAYAYDFSPTEIGTYSYTITATDTSGNPATSSGSFAAVDTTDPVANAGADQSVAPGTTITFNGTGSADLGGIASYSWSFEDAGSQSLTGPSPTYRFDNPGTFTVTLTVTDGAGNTATDTVVITVTAAVGPGPLGLGWEIWGLIVAAAGGGIAALVWALRKRPKRPVDATSLGSPEEL